MHIVSRIVGILALSFVASACNDPRPEWLTESRLVMGTAVKIVAEGPGRAELARAVDAAFLEMGRLSDTMNHYDSTSAVSAINDAAGVRPVTVPPELMTVLEMAQRTSARTGGAFDITVGGLRGWRFDPERPAWPTAARIAVMRPLVNYRRLRLDAQTRTAYLEKRGMRIDLGGIAKLYILHAGMRVLAQHGVAHALIDAGGDVEARGTTQGRPWRIGIRDPHTPQSLYAVVEITAGFVVSSGDYERYFIKDGKRYHHILDPRTGYPATGPHHVTLVAESLETVNGLSAAIMVMGATAGRALIERTPGLEGLIVDRDGGVWTSPGLAARLRPPP